MDSYSSLSLQDLLDAFAASRPVPAGGSAVALAAATGVSLLVMVAGMHRTRTGAVEESAALSGAAERLRPLRATLTGLIDRDAQAYESVLAARRLPAGSETETGARQQAVDAAMRAAADTQLETLQACREALRDAIVVAEHGARSAQGDAGVAIELLLAAAHGASVNVAINLASITDADYLVRVAADRERLDGGVAADAERGLALLRRQGPRAGTGQS